ncbi:hypothetical protein [Ensifer soli]|uniref:hypothetical protein n=1 Tax=Ciceribacter sp. sgz301302 TaxID=3342379 RepID=UPI0035BA1067
MTLYIAAFAALLIVYLAARSSRFRNIAEPILSVGVAILLLVAFVIWLTDRPAPEPQSEDVAAPALTAADLSISAIAFEPARQATSYRATGTVTNASTTARLDYFRLEATLETCPDRACTPVGSDEALIVLAVPPGQSRSFETFFVVAPRDGAVPVDPQWVWEIRDVRGQRVD